MAKQIPRTELSSSDFEDETSSYSDNQQKRPSNVAEKKDSIKNYVTNVLQRHGIGDEEQTDSTRTQIKIDTRASTYRGYENISAFRQYQSNIEGTPRTDAQQRQDLISDDENNLRRQTSTEQVRTYLLRFIFPENKNLKKFFFLPIFISQMNQMQN
jgi:hypothetical protein